MLPAEGGEQLLEPSLTLTCRAVHPVQPGCPVHKVAAGGGAGPGGKDAGAAPPSLPSLDRGSLGSKRRMWLPGGCGFFWSGPLATPICGPWEGQWRGFGHPVQELPWTLLSTLASSRVTPHGTRSPGPSEAQPRALGEARCPAGREAGWCSPRRVRERWLRAVCGMFSRGFSISALLTPRDGRSWWGHLSWASQDGGLHPWSLST